MLPSTGEHICGYLRVLLLYLDVFTFPPFTWPRDSPLRESLLLYMAHIPLFLTSLPYFPLLSFLYLIAFLSLIWLPELTWPGSLFLYLLPYLLFFIFIIPLFLTILPYPSFISPLLYLYLLPSFYLATWLPGSLNCVLPFLCCTCLLYLPAVSWPCVYPRVMLCFSFFGKYIYIFFFNLFSS